MNKEKQLLITVNKVFILFNILYFQLLNEKIIKFENATTIKSSGHNSFDLSRKDNL